MSTYFNEMGMPCKAVTRDQAIKQVSNDRQSEYGHGSKRVIEDPSTGALKCKFTQFEYLHYHVTDHCAQIIKMVLKV